MKLFIVIVVTALLFGACVKSGVSNNGCVESIRLTPSDSIPFAGDTIKIYANQPGLIYSWSGPDNFFVTAASSNYITLEGIRIHQTGWYYCGASAPGCTPHEDSVYIRVQYQQGTPPCSLSNDRITNTIGMPDVTPTYITKNYDPGSEAVTVSVFSGIGYPEFYFVFNSFNGNTEPKDGIYYTTSIDAFDPLQDADVINMNFIYGIDYFTSNDGQKIYVSHVNGKLRISFCGIKIDQTSNVTGTITGQVTEQ